MEKGMTMHSRILAWRIPGTEEPGGLQSMWLQRFGHDWVTHTPTVDQWLYGLQFFFQTCILKICKWMKYLYNGHSYTQYLDSAINILLYFLCYLNIHLAISLVTLMVKNPPAMQETWVQSLSQEDPLEKRMATRSSFPAWIIPWKEEEDGLQSWGHRESDTTEWLTLSLLNILLSKSIHLPIGLSFDVF